MKNKSFDKIIFSIVLSFTLLGLFFVFDASSVKGATDFNDPLYFFKKQLLFFSAGIFGSWLMMKINLNFWKKFAFVFLVLGFIGLCLVFVPELGGTQKGATRWIYLGPISIQPAEFFKLSLIFYLASFFSKKQQKMDNFLETVFPFLVTLAIVATIMLFQKSFGMLVVLCFIAIVMFFAAGASIKKILTITIPVVLILSMFVWFTPYRRERLLTFLNPETADKLGSGYQVNQAIISIGSGGLTGVGLGHSRQKLEFLPETMGDSIFAIVAEETGFIGVSVILVMISVFAYQGLEIAKRAKENFHKLVAIGIVSGIVFQFIFNVGAISGMLPLSGIPLPFFSYGGSSLVSTLLMCGILLNISKQA